MEMKEIKINVPEGYEIDVKNSTFEKIIFKKKEAKRWRDDTKADIKGYFIETDSTISNFSGYNTPNSDNVFATRKLAESALAMARISQIMANDDRFGGPITEKEWANSNIDKYIINRDCVYNQITISIAGCSYRFIAFHEMSQARLFLGENRDLINDYFMIS